jgi:hypothetical protein
LQTQRVRNSLDSQLLQLVAQGAEGDAELGGGLGLVVAVVGQRLFDRLALDFLDEAGQGAAGDQVGPIIRQAMSMLVRSRARSPM